MKHEKYKKVNLNCKLLDMVLASGEGVEINYLVSGEVFKQT